MRWPTDRPSIEHEHRARRRLVGAGCAFEPAILVIDLHVTADTSFVVHS